MNCNILVLVDFSESSYTALKYAIAMAKKTKANIHLFHVTNASNILESENPLAVQRSIDETGTEVREKLKSLVEIIVEEKITVTYDYSFGNERDEIEEHISFIGPDITLLGRRTQRLNYRGKITSHLLNKHKGCILIVGKDKFFNSKTKIALACNKKTLEKYNLKIVFDLHHFVSHPLSIINILTNSAKEEEVQSISSAEDLKIGKNKLQFEHPINMNVTEGLVDHIIKEEVELICIGRSKDTNWLLNRFFGRGSTSTNIVEKIDVPVLILGIK